MTASNRSLQWREKVIEPLFESRTDHMIMYQLAQKFGFDKEFVGAKIKLLKGKGGMDEPSMEDTLREINRGMWTIGYTGQSPERLQAHMRNMHVFDVKTLRAKGGKDAKTGYVLDGDYFGLPWPCYGTPEIKHPGSPNLYRHVAARDGRRRQLPRELSASSATASTCWPRTARTRRARDITTGYPEFDHVLLKKLGWWDELTDDEKKAAEGKNWKTDLSGGIQRVVHEEPRLPSVRQRQGARRGVELPGRRAAAPRAALQPAPGPGREVPDARRREGAAGACRRCSRRCSRTRTRTRCQEVSR